MARTLICTLLLLGWSDTAWAQILDVRELNTDQIARLDRAGILEEHGPFLPSYTHSYQSEFIATRVAAAVAGRSPWTVLRFPDIEHSCLLFLPPDLVAPAIRSAPAVVTRDFAQLVATAETPNWPGYFGTPAIANPEAGRRAMGAIAQAAVDVVLKVLDGGSDEGPRSADRSTAEPEFRRVVDLALEYERQIERKQAAWLAKQR